MTNNKSIEQIDFLKMMQLREELVEKLKEKRAEYAKIVENLDEKYRDILEEHEKEAEKVQLIVDSFNSKWEPKLFDYQQKVKELKKKSKKEIKQLEQQYKQKEKQLIIN